MPHAVSTRVRPEGEMLPEPGESSFTVLFDACRDPVFVESEDGVVLDVNAAACALHRCGKRDLIGRSVVELVPEDDREMMRERFAGWGDGCGLGLAAVLGIARSHDGVLQVESEEGVGARFTVCFPERVAEEEAALTSKRRAEARPFSGKALFVDDEDSVRILGAKLLESFECNVVTARDGAEAVEAFRAGKGEFGLIVMDLSMPRMGGKEAWEAIRKMDPEVPVLLVSGYSNAALGDMDERTGFLAKPFRGKDLWERIGELTSGRSD